MQIMQPSVLFMRVGLNTVWWVMLGYNVDDKIMTVVVRKYEL